MALIRETLTLAAFALRSILTINPTGGTGDPVIPLHGLADSAGDQLGIAGNAMVVSDGNNAPFQNAVALTVGGPAVAPGKSVGVNCSAAGTMTLALAGGGSITLPIEQGWQTFAFAATGVSTTAEGAAASFYNLS